MRRLLIASLLVLLHLPVWADGQTANLPDPKDDAALARQTTPQTAILAGGCFWGVQAVFQHVKGVISATSGYAGGSAATANYETVSSGTSGHAETVKVIYDPATISYGRLLKIYFAVAHNPTELNRQGPDTGTQYRSVIFAANAEQQRIAESYIGQLDAAHIYPKQIATKVAGPSPFYPAESYHQDFAALHPNHPYIVFNDRPKVEHLKELFPHLYH